MTQGKTGKTREQILAAAACLFAKQGYRGVSTREIARTAKVNEITIYRYYARKHDLFVAALEAELDKMRVHPELVAKLVNARDLRASLRGVFELLSDVLAQQPNLVRLLQFSLLEFGVAHLPACRKRLGGLLDLSVQSLQQWIEVGEMRPEDLRILVLAFTATIVGLPTLYPAFWNDQAALLDGRELPMLYADIWYPALRAKGKPKDGYPTA